MKTLHAVLYCLLLILGGCSSHKTSGSHNWMIAVGSGGGITGGSTGYTLHASGSVESWQIAQAGGLKQITKLFEMDCDSANFYKTYLDLIRFDTIQYSKLGNWTIFVELSQGEVAHRVSWTGDTGPRHVVSFHELLTGYITSRTKQ